MLHLVRAATLFVSILCTSVFAADTLTINAAEFGIGKFHRKDNQVHPYSPNNAWTAFILPNGVPTTQAYVMTNVPGSNYTIFYTNLEELMRESVKLSLSTGKKIGVLNINAHGLPGGMWFPMNEKFRESIECNSWREAANGSDEDNYNQYYSGVSKSELDDIESMSNEEEVPGFSCITGIKQWTWVSNDVPEFKTSFSSDAQIHMLSCTVGLGPLGEKFTTELAKLLFPNGGTQRIETSIKLGLGDWSMPEGMGFWGYISDEQLERDNRNYVAHKEDREQMQKGDIRVADVDGQGAVASLLIQNDDFMFLAKDGRKASSIANDDFARPIAVRNVSRSVRIPGTAAMVHLW